MTAICCIGHTTLDIVITSSGERHLPGGTSYYFSAAMAKFDVPYKLITAIAEEDDTIIEAIKQTGVSFRLLPTRQTVSFVNIYGDNPDERTQRVTQQADPFSISAFEGEEAQVFHLGPLLADDFSVDLIKFLSGKGRVSLDVQGFLRRVDGEQVMPVAWTSMAEALQYVDIIKANDEELATLTGLKDLKEGMHMIAAYGVSEVIATLGSRGSLILSDNCFYEVPAFVPNRLTDVTGCGDTYMAGYLYKRSKGCNIADAAIFASAMASLKTNRNGPFNGTEMDIETILRTI